MLRTPLNDFHVRLGAKMVNFAGWEMPLLYTGIVAEHHHTRQAGSIFDVSHMGRIELRGHDAEVLLEYTCTRRLGDMATGQCRYSHICNEQAGILDDVIVSRYDDHWLVICNAVNRKKIFTWLRGHERKLSVQTNDTTESTFMVAIQGPAVMTRISELLPIRLKGLRRYHFVTGHFMQIPYTISRTGYTGEDGIELTLPAEAAPILSDYLVNAIEGDIGLKPAGLGARDTLRLEAAMPLYGHELHEKVDSLSAGQAWCVDLNKDFIGVEALRAIARSGPQRKLVGLQIQGPRIARQHTVVYHDNDVVGQVTSGTFSPTLKRSIALAYVDQQLAESGQSLAIELGGKRIDAVVVKLPFYKRMSENS